MGGGDVCGGCVVGAGPDVVDSGVLPKNLE